MPDRDKNRGGDIVLPSQKDTAVEGSTEKIFTFKGAVIDGSTIYDPAELGKSTQPFVGQEVSFADLNQIANKLTLKYREDGYIFSRIIIPPQKIQDGIVHFSAIEGRVENVDVTGDFKDDNGLIRALASKIRTNGPTNTRDIERYLLLIDDLPGITARSFVKPSEESGAGDLVIVIEQDPFEGAATISNRGSRYVGPWRAELVGAFNSLFGIHDRTTLRAIAATQTSELRYGEIIHEEQISTEGVRVKGRYAVTSTEPGGDLSSLGIEGDNKLFDIEGLYPVIRSRDLNLNLYAGFMMNNTNTDLSGLPVGDDRIRSARLRSELDFADRWGINQLDAEYTHGLDGLGSTDDGTGRSRANGRHDFQRVNVTATRVQNLGIAGVSAMVSATGQYTKDPLLASEEFSLGGEGFGRAYDAGELTGDRGYAGVAELRYSDTIDGALLQDYQLYTFIDYGKVKNLRPVVGEAGADSLSSAGVGVRYNLTQGFSGYLELDKPLNKNVNSEGDDGVRVITTLVKRF